MKIGVEKCVRVAKAEILDLEKFVMARMITKTSISTFRDMSIRFESNGFDYKKMFGFGFIMFLLVLVFVVMGKRGGRKGALKKKYTLVKKEK